MHQQGLQGACVHFERWHWWDRLWWSKGCYQFVSCVYVVVVVARGYGQGRLNCQENIEGGNFPPPCAVVRGFSSARPQVELGGGLTGLGW